MLLVFTEDNVPTWEIRRKAEKVAGRDDDLERPAFGFTRILRS
jgi:hypothetical protein